MDKAFVLLLLFISCSLFPQSKMEELKKKLELADNDSTFIKTALEIGNSFMRVDLDSAFYYFSQAEWHSKDMGNRLLWATSKYRKGNVNRRKNELNLAQAEYDTAFGIFTEFNDIRGLVGIKTELASLALSQKQTEKAVILYLEALAYAREIKDKNEEARIYNYLGGIYRRQKLYKKALENYEHALTLVQELNFNSGISACLSNLASVHATLGNHDKALTYLEEALIIKKETADILGASRVLGTMGNLYNQLQKYDLAKEHYEQTLELATTVGDPKTIRISEYRLADIDFNQKNYRAAIERGEKLIAGLEGASDLQLKTDIYSLMSRAYEAIKIPEKALFYARREKVYSDSIYNQDIAKATADLESQYKSEQQQQEIAILAAERDLQSLQISKRVNERNLIILLALISIVIAALLYNQFRIKRSANNKLRELDTFKSDFFTNISHEFRTPLTIISGMAREISALKMEESTEGLETIIRNTDYLHKLIDQLLDLSKLESGAMQVKMRQGDIVYFLKYIIGSFQSLAHHKQIEIKFRNEEEQIIMDYEPDKFLHIVSNLLGNAIKYSNTGGEINIAIRLLKPLEKQVEISIRDNGIGVNNKDLPHIFDRFYQGVGNEQFPYIGTGIGLALVKELVHLFKGTIGVKSEVGKGTEFVIQFPITRNATPLLMPPERALKSALRGYLTPPPQLVNENKNGQEKQELLIVEDNTDVTNFLVLCLQENFAITTAPNGKIGLKLAIEKVPDIIISDVMMPELNGFAFCQKIKDDFRTSHIPVILLTAKADQKAKIAGLEYGADAYLTKPFDKKELLTRLKKLLELRLALQHKFSLSIGVNAEASNTKPSLDEQFLIRVNSILEAHLDNDTFGINDLCTSYGISRVQLHRKLKALTQLSASHYIRRYKLIRAKELINSSEMTISEVAYAVGFKSPAYFSQVFSEVFGFPPSEMRTTPSA